jgi:hypothetical protein
MKTVKSAIHGVGIIRIGWIDFITQSIAPVPQYSTTSNFHLQFSVKGYSGWVSPGEKLNGFPGNFNLAFPKICSEGR